MVGKIKSRLSKWKINTLSIGGRLTLLKAVLGSTPIYPMSLYKVPKTVLHEMESLRRNFFNGVQGVDRKIWWVKWTKVLASKKYGGLGVSSFYALNRALLFRWVWRFLSNDNSLWFRFISAMHGSSFQTRSSFHCSNWLYATHAFGSSLVSEVPFNVLFLGCRLGEQQGNDGLGLDRGWWTVMLKDDS
ncbi:hypothetical protein Tco_1257262 [Tanacetum coccineum]